MAERTGGILKTFVIAETGSTWRIGAKQKLHLAYAKKCIRTAKAAGADCVKFQWCSQPGLMAERRHIHNVGAYNLLAWPVEWLKILAAECEEIGIEFMCTVFIAADVPTIAPFVKRFKVASLEAFDGQFCQSCIDTGKPVVISVGACGWQEAATKFFPHEGWTWRGIKVLHCVAAYPAPVNQMNLGVIRNGYYGLSDHSGDLLAGALAVACGAEIIEVHFRLDETRVDNPDYDHSHSPAGLKVYIQNIRKAELMLGDGIKKVERCEEPMLAHRVTA